MEASLPAEFHAFDSSHLAVLGLFLVLATTFITLTRGGWLRAARAGEIILAGLLFLQWPFNFWVAWRYETIQVTNVLPFHLCDVAAFLGIVALITHKQEACELLYFWGLAGTLQGLITPSLTLDWPHPRFFMFFLLHCGVVLAAAQVVLGRRIYPRKGAVPRAMGWLVVYGLAAGTADFLLRWANFDANFGFLCDKPKTASLFDQLGPWPWYLAATVPLAWMFFSILDLPFLILRRSRGSRRRLVS